MTTPADLQLLERFAYATIERIDVTEAPHLRAARSRQNETLLHIASNGATVRALLAAGLDPHARDDRGRTPLLHHHDAEGNRSLLEAGADIHAVSADGHGALYWQANPPPAVVAGYGAPDFDALEVLLAAGAKRPSHDDARQWIEWAHGLVSHGSEHNQARIFEAWLQRLLGTEGEDSILRP